MSDKDIITGLRATFDLHDHELRPLITKDNFTRWSVYIRREAITNRLDDLFGPFEWEFEINQRVERSGYVAYNGTIVIKGRSRANNGGASGTDENTDKAALTDCFKRCASSWGIGLYLQNTPDIMTGPIGQWDAKEKRFKVDYARQASMEADALKKFAEWWQTLTPGNTDKAPTTTTTPPPAQNGTQAPPNDKPSTPKRTTSKSTGNVDEAPGAMISKIMSDKTVQATWSAPKEGRATINKMWREGELKEGMDEADMILAVIERLQAHKAKAS